MEDIYRDGSEVSLKVEAFVHYTYVKSREKLMVVDIQGKGCCLCDPEIANAELRDANDNTILKSKCVMGYGHCGLLAVMGHVHFFFFFFFFFQFLNKIKRIGLSYFYFFTFFIFTLFYLLLLLFCLQNNYS